MSRSFYSIMKDYLRTIEKNIDLRDLCNNNLSDLLDPFLVSVAENGAVPYVLDKKERYRASPLASVIIWMNKSNLLNEEAIQILQHELIYLRDNSEKYDNAVGNLRKIEGDEFAWSLSEGCSVWSTSLSIIALFENLNIDLSHHNIEKTIGWLINQQDVHSSGWAYQKNETCKVNTIMTALAVYALATAYIHGKEFFDEDTNNRIISAMIQGTDFLDKSFVNRKYCCFNDSPNVFATVWSLCALKKVFEADNSYEKARSIFDDNLNGCLRFILSKIPLKEKWQTELIVSEAGANYAAQKNYYSLNTTLIPQLIDLGVSPFDPRVISQIRRLLADKNDWKIEEYNKQSPCAFTYAMIVSTIIYWYLKTGAHCACSLCAHPKDKAEKVIQFVYGYHNVRSQRQIRFIRKNRLYLYSCFVISICTYLIFHKEITDLVYNLFVYLFSYSGGQTVWNTIILNVVSSFLFLGISSLIAYVAKKIWRKLRGKND